MTLPYLAGVVQFPVYGVEDDASARQMMRRNGQRMAAVIDALSEVSAQRPRLLVFPALCLTGGYRRARGIAKETVAVELPGEELAPVVGACRRNNCFIAATVQERVPQLPGHVFHSAFILGPQGLVLRSPKSQAFSAAGISSLREIYDDYAAIFGEAAVLPVARTELGTLGCLVEAEVQVIEAGRLLVSKGADVILNSALEFGDTAGSPHAAVKQNLAYGCGVFLLATSRSREILKGEGTWTGGSSSIYGPDGVPRARLAPNTEGVAYAEIDLNEVAQARQEHGRDTAPASRLYRTLFA